jgi:hypothetical protein
VNSQVSVAGPGPGGGGQRRLGQLVARQAQEVGIYPPVRCHHSHRIDRFIDVPHRRKPVGSNPVPG